MDTRDSRGIRKGGKHEKMENIPEEGMIVSHSDYGKLILGVVAWSCYCSNCDPSLPALWFPEDWKKGGTPIAVVLQHRESNPTELYVALWEDLEIL